MLWWTRFFLLNSFMSGWFGFCFQSILYMPFYFIFLWLSPFCGTVYTNRGFLLGIWCFVFHLFLIVYWTATDLNYVHKWTVAQSIFWNYLSNFNTQLCIWFESVTDRFLLRHISTSANNFVMYTYMFSYYFWKLIYSALLFNSDEVEFWNNKSAVTVRTYVQDE